ncbi:alpha/beta fold hydrolase [Kibdelosporangium aridum]|uniref:Pimeloyl-ACP methyl ester carboxylesterase n=1 Tax=Kibdelosporangium aridum TaxID=2030 RepID=A0A1Y5WVG1_KIBAR|nr:alpha/beta hydrolase [Kibdelosporangium aridum]SMC53711.1 Pimeloyl-ACP methyl ester carboxylesterase [Kibdelosporangium aridum]
MTDIKYRTIGQGPGIVVLHGAMCSGYDHLQLAEAMAHRHTVHLVDRRGRGLSQNAPPGNRIATEVADLGAVLAATGAQDVFGVSSGAIVCLEAARVLPAIRRAAIFEPPLFPGRDVPAAFAATLNRHLDRGRTASALVTGMKGAQMGPAFLRAIPTWLLAPLIGAGVRAEQRKPPTDYLTMAALAPTLRQDFTIVTEASGPADRFATITADVLLLGGSESPLYLKEALDVLGKAIPHATFRELAGADHSAASNTDRRGRPGDVAEALLSFFAA